MKITKTRLKQIIQEEWQLATEAPPHGGTVSLPRSAHRGKGPSAGVMLSSTKELIKKIKAAMKDANIIVKARLQPAEWGYAGELKFSHPTIPITKDMFNNIWNDSDLNNALAAWEGETGIEMVINTLSIKKGDGRTYGDVLIMPVTFYEGSDD